MTETQLEHLLAALDAIKTSLQGIETALVAKRVPKKQEPPPEHLETLHCVGLEVVQSMARYYGVDPSAILSNRRHADTVRARHAAIARLMDEHGWRCREIARYFKIDHS